MRSRCYFTLLAVLTIAIAATLSCSRGSTDAQIANEVRDKINADANIPTKQVVVAREIK